MRSNKDPIQAEHMYGLIKQHLENTIKEIREAGLYKNERVIDGPQDARIDLGRFKDLA